MKYALVDVHALRPGILSLAFDDGLAGEFDLSDEITNQPMFAPLRDATLFGAVAIDTGGSRFGWKLDDVGHEIDFCADAARIRLETDAERRLADSYRSRRVAAE
jgi:hypothetical protein